MNYLKFKSITGWSLCVFYGVKEYGLWKSVETEKLIPYDHKGEPIDHKIIQKLKTIFEAAHRQQPTAAHERPSVGKKGKTDENVGEGRAPDVQSNKTRTSKQNRTAAPRPATKNLESIIRQKPSAQMPKDHVTLGDIPSAAPDAAPDPDDPDTWKDFVYEKVKNFSYNVEDILACFQEEVEACSPLPKETTAAVKQEESPKNYIDRRRREGEQDKVIAAELYDKKDFKLRYMDIDAYFGLGREGVNTTPDANKKRGMRFVQKGERYCEDGL